MERTLGKSFQSVYLCRDCRARFWGVSRDAYVLAGIAALVAGVTMVLVIAGFALWGDLGTAPLRREEVREGADRLEETIARAQANDPAAEYQLAKHFLRGYGVPMDYQKAIDWMRSSAMQGYAPAQLDYGLMLRGGEGVIQDWKESVKWIHRAAENGHAPAQKELGILYMKGAGVAQDYRSAYKWLVLATAAGVAGASVLRDALVTKLSPEEIERAQAEARAYAEGRGAPATPLTRGMSAAPGKR